MNPENFTFWLKGYMEQIGDAPTPEQWEKIKTQMHIALHPPVNNIQPYMAPQQWQTPVRYLQLPSIICGAH